LRAGFPTKTAISHRMGALQMRGKVAILGQLQQGGNGGSGVPLAIEGGVCYSWIVADEY